MKLIETLKKSQGELMENSDKINLGSRDRRNARAGSGEAER